MPTEMDLKFIKFFMKNETENAQKWLENLAVNKPKCFVSLAIMSGLRRVEAMEELSKTTLCADIEKNPDRYTF